MITYSSAACTARWLVVIAAFWLGVTLWSPGSQAFTAEPAPVASAVHLGEEFNANEPCLRCPQRSPVKRPRAAGGPAPAGGPPARVARAARSMVEEVPTRGAGHADRLVRLSVWRV